MLFGSLFSSYALLRSGAMSWPDQSSIVDIRLASIDTVVLIARRCCDSSDFPSRPPRTRRSTRSSAGVEAERVPVESTGRETGHRASVEQGCDSQPRPAADACGIGHYRLRGFYTIQTQADFDAWLASQPAGL
jgi:hypothetical protein